MELELRQLRSFVAVSEHRNFTRAAKSLGIGQPSLSAQIRQLERRVGVELLRRSSRSVELTAAGEAMLPEVRSLLHDADVAFGDLPKAPAADNVVRLDGVHDFCDTSLRIVEEVVGGGRPALEVRTGRGLADQLEPLRRGTLDVALGRTDGVNAEFESRPIRDERVILAVAATHPLASRGRVDAAEVIAYPVFVGRDDERAPEWIEFAVRRCGAELRPAPDRGMASSTLVKRTAEETFCALETQSGMIEAADLRCVEVDGWPDYRWSAVWLRARRAEASVAALLEAADAAGARHGWQRPWLHREPD